ncbi:MAG TPA: hypothetical protein VIW45_09490 [Vicinamibacterales bacterium]
MTLLVGSNFYNGDASAMRRQQAAIDAVTALRDVVPVNLQWRSERGTNDDACERPDMETLAVLQHDSRSILGRAVRRKPVMPELFDALADAAAPRRCRYVAFYNADIVVTQEAIDAIVRGGRQSYGFSRMDVDRESGRDLGLMPNGIDMFAFDVAWWRSERHRFRDYILGEWFYDPVFAALMLRYGDGLILNRRGEIRHEVHEHKPPSGPAAEYNGYLAALDSPYFSMWATYRTRLDELRARGATEEEELALQRGVFRRPMSLGSALYHAARCTKAFVRYRLRG